MPVIQPNKTKALAILNTALSMNLMAFAAKTTPWPNDSEPPAVDETQESVFNSDIIFLKTLTGSAIRLMVTRKNWSVSSFAVNDFVYTEDHNVYRCVVAGSSGQKPTHQSGEANDLNGSARWEFSEHVTLADIGSFLTEDLIPLSLACERYLYAGLVNSFGIKFDFVGNEDEFLPLTSQFRVVGLYANPLDRYARVNTSNHKETVKEYGFVLAWDNISPTPRTQEQIDSYTFFINLN